MTLDKKDNKKLVNPIDEIINRLLIGIDNPHTKRGYKRALSDFLEYWRLGGKLEINKNFVENYKAGLIDLGVGVTSINQRLSAIKRFVSELADNGLVDDRIKAGINNIKNIRQEGRPVGNWLTLKEAVGFLDAPLNFVKNVKRRDRDRALLAVLLGAGLRRNEAAGLTWGHIQTRQDRAVIVDIIGKRTKRRTVPIANWTMADLETWRQILIINGMYDPAGPVFLRIHRSGSISPDPIGPQSIYKIVLKYAKLSGFDVKPHDLRRTFAKLAYLGDADIKQISKSLGHASVMTTEKYIGADQDLENAPADALGIERTAINE